VNALDRLLELRRFGSDEAHGHVNTPDDEHAVLGFHFSGHVSREFAVAGIDLARFQRTSEGAKHSTSGGADDIVDGCGVRVFQFGGIDFVVLGNGTMNAVDDRLGFSGKMGDA
jgi:hypothetical protein